VIEIFLFLDMKEAMHLARTSKAYYSLFLSLPYMWSLRSALLEEAMGTCGVWNQSFQELDEVYHTSQGQLQTEPSDFLSRLAMEMNDERLAHLKGMPSRFASIVIPDHCLSDALIPAMLSFKRAIIKFILQLASLWWQIKEVATNEMCK
jgi:hypothetical protein